MDERPAAMNTTEPMQAPAETENYRLAAEDALPEPMAEPVAEPVTPVQTQQTATTGDALEIQSGETLPVHLLEFPRRGMTMDKVQNELGQPIEMSLPIGEPPITTWSYGDRVVYFEHSTVLHVVASK